MPELPEVETTRQGLEPLLRGARIAGLLLREPRLRWRVPDGLPRALRGRRIRALDRRGKVLLLRCDGGTLLLHLGMSGSLRVARRTEPRGPHDRLDLALAGGTLLRLRDPRRFAAVLWTTRDPLEHPLLRRLGQEPLAPGFRGRELWRRARGRRAPVKVFLMDGRAVAGIGNIYATEALFRAGIHPARPAGRVSRARYERLSRELRAVLREALAAGGTTLRDYRGGSGAPGRFRPRLRAYGRQGAPCRRCGSTLRALRLGQRQSVFCPRCQR